MKNNLKKPIEDLSNMVFGLALSIGSLEFVVNLNVDHQVVLDSLFTFFFNFILVVYIWFRYTRALSLIRVENRIEMDLNILLLFLIIIEPYLFDLLNASNLPSDLDFSSVLFAFDVGTMMLILGVIYTIGLRYYKNKDKDKEKDNTFLYSYDSIKIGLYITGIIFIISAMPTFWEISLLGTKLRFISWVVGTFITFFYRGFEHFKNKTL